MPDLLLLLVGVPLATGFIGWVTNWSAVKMIFHPANFRGIGPIGWQGIIPRNAAKFARGTADMATQNLISARELAERLDPDELEQVFAEALDDQAEPLVADAAEIVRPGAWQQLPEPVRGQIVDQVRQRSRTIARELFDQLQGVSREVLDLHHLVYTQLSGPNVERMSRFMRETGAREFKFIEHYGGFFGFAIGVMQVGVWSVMQRWWVMPIAGVLVGLVTNWMAIQMIFRPFEPTKYLGFFTYQGLFPKRQAEIAVDYSRLMADEIFTARNLIRLVTEGPGGERVTGLIADTLSARLDSEWEQVKNMVPVEVTDEQRAQIKERVVQGMFEAAPDALPHLEDYLDRKLEVGRVVEDKLRNMSKPEFERLLRGVFEEDEITLVLVGGFLGGAVGCLQAAVILSL